MAKLFTEVTVGDLTVCCEGRLNGTQYQLLKIEYRGRDITDVIQKLGIGKAFLNEAVKKVQANKIRVVKK